jgi:hypothetical protein
VELVVTFFLNAAIQRGPAGDNTWYLKIWRYYIAACMPTWLSSSNPNFSKPRSITANSDFRGRLTHQLLGRLKTWNPQFLICRSIYQKGKFWNVGVGDWQSMQVTFLSLRMDKCLERVNDRHFWNPGVFSYAMIPRCGPNSRVCFFIVASIVYEYTCQ